MKFEITKKDVKRAFKIFFADADNAFSRLASIISGLFWLYFNVLFFKFFLTYALGLSAYIMSGDSYSVSWSIIQENRELISTLSLVFSLIIMVMRIPLYTRKEVKK